jgi:hypothetical protein
MSVLETLQNIKIPYATEGVIRTAQLDDTVAPEDSVQLAVNMNFDRVGAIQTRLGVAEYAPTLSEEITNFGTLRNALISAGYERMAQVGDESILTQDFQDPAAVKMSDSKVAVFWSGVDNDGFCANYELDQETGTMTQIGTPLEFDTGSASNIKVIAIDSNFVLVVWTGVSGDGFAQIFNTAFTSIIAVGTALEFDTANGEDFTLAQIDSTHFICFYQSTGSDGVATVFAVDTGVGVTEPGSPLTFDSTANSYNSCVALGNGTHFINFWFNGTNLSAQTFSVNTGTWAVTAIGSALVTHGGFDNNAMTCGDGEHFVNVSFGSTPSTGIRAQAFNVDSGTFAVTAVGTSVILSTSAGDTTAVGFGDGEHFAAFYSESAGVGFAQMLEMDPLTFDMSLQGARIPGYDFSSDGITSINLELNKVMVIWATDGEVEGKSAMFQSFGPVVNGRWLYAGHGDEVSNLASGTWTSRRSGLAQVSKPRFSQYLNYIWMVNGNESIGGDPIATSDGGNFGDDLVPEGFPPGDFISAGFEGRVWVADKTLGILYYTDIVQFTPPIFYTLTYNPDVNFITTISPQTGETFTALYEVPRALLVFTENSITRVYGSTSLDAYPAYNVGTFSQESIIETKEGIYFHHSSGFYQFDYGSQPVEISRRIIDFVKAIPRSSYEDITGVYDGFDAVEWSVGQVTVEGVLYTNCVLRYTISTQVWTIYDYPLNIVTAMVYYDDGVNINHLMGTEAGKVGAMDSGTTDFGQPFYFEFIDRWRSFTEMYYQNKSISGLNVYSENAAGANVSYQIQKSGPNAWKPIFTITEANNSLSPNNGTEPFDVLRIRVAGNTKGTQVVIHGMEITQLTVLGQEIN